MERDGVKLLRGMTALGAVVLVLAAAIVVTARIFAAAKVHNARAAAMGEANRAMQAMLCELRQAARETLAVDSPDTAGSSIVYRAAEDLDLNGYAVDTSCALELGGPRRIRRNPYNAAQLVLEEKVDEAAWKATRVLAEHLGLDLDTDGDGNVDRWGVRFSTETDGRNTRSFRIDLRIVMDSPLRGPPIVVEESRAVMPRN